MNIYEILEDFQYKFTRGDLDRRWNMVGMPKHIESVVEEREEELIKEQEIFQEQMEVEQMDFKENISNLERTINNFSRY